MAKPFSLNEPGGAARALPSASAASDGAFNRMALPLCQYQYGCCYHLNQVALVAYGWRVGHGARAKAGTQSVLLSFFQLQVKAEAPGCSANAARSVTDTL